MCKVSQLKTDSRGVLRQPVQKTELAIWSKSRKYLFEIEEWHKMEAMVKIRHEILHQIGRLKAHDWLAPGHGVVPKVAKTNCSFLARADRLAQNTPTHARETHRETHTSRGPGQT